MQGEGIPTGLSWRQYALLALLCLALFWPGIRTIPAIDRDEARFAEASRQMAASGDWVDIRFQAETRYKKPAGIYWLQTIAVKALGEDKANPIWPYRLPSLLAAIGAVLMTARLGTRVGDMRTGVTAALLLATSLLLNAEARLATADAVLLLTVLVAMEGLYGAIPIERSGRGIFYRPEDPSPSAQDDNSFLKCVPFWVAIAGGILIKGPVILLVVGATAATVSITNRDWRWLKATRPVMGIALVAALVAPWLVLITLKSHGAFFAESLGHDMAGKMAGGQEGHWAPPGLYLLEMPLAFWPGSLAVLLAVPFVWSQRHHPEVAFLLAWLIPSWLVFEAVPTKLPHYVLPLYPALALLAALAWQVRFPGPRAARIAAVLVFTILSLFALPGGAFIGWTLSSKTVFVADALAKQRAAYDAPLRTGPVAFVGFHEPSAVLTFGPDTLLAKPYEAAAELAEQHVVLVYVEAEDAPAFMAAATADGIAPHEFDRLDGFNYARGKTVTMRVFRRE